MIINKNAWHYQLQSKVGTSPAQRTSLCSYMRGLFITFVLLGIAAVATAALFFLLSSLLWGWFVPDAGGTMFVGGIYLATIIVAMVHSEEHQDNFWCKNITPTIKTPSIFIAWIKSLHDKTCPLVEFKDD